MKTKEPSHALECPNCFHRMFTDQMCDEALQSAPNVAKELDFTICAACGIFLRYDSDKSVRVATEDDLDELHPDQLVMARHAQKVVRSPEYQEQFKAGVLTRERR